MSNNSRNYTIDCLRIPMALLVVAVHTSPLAEYSSLLSYLFSQVLSRLAVPFFATVSGFFFFANPNRHNTLRALRSYFCVYARWSLLYILTEICINDSIENKAYYILNTFFLTGYYQLWYLLALIYTVLLVLFFQRFKRGIRFLYYFSFLLLTFGILAFGYGKLFANMPFFFRLKYDTPIFIQGPTIVLPFFMLGYRLREKPAEAFFFKRAEAFLCLSLLAYFAEVVLLEIFDLKQSTTLCLLTYPLTYFIILCALKYPGIGTKQFSRTACRTANFIYFSHIFFVIIFQRLGLSETPIFCLTSILTLLIGVAISNSDDGFRLKIIG